MTEPKDDQYSEEETKRRAEEALRAAFKTPPIPNKKVPAAPPMKDSDDAAEAS